MVFGSTRSSTWAPWPARSEVLVAYNVSGEHRADCVIVEASYRRAGETMAFLYGAKGRIPVRETPEGARFVQLDQANQLIPAA